MEIKNRYTGEVIKTVDADNLYRANLYRADLTGANLYRADLYRANLTGANLTRANLTGADLYRADLTRADLYRAKFSWQSHTLIAEILKRAAEDDIQKRMIAGLIAISFDWCWKEFLAIPHDLREWALDTLAGYVVEGDDAPEVLKSRVTVKTEAPTDGA